MKNGQWKEADQETNRVMLQVGDKDDKAYLNSDDILNFPCYDLRTIDQLWVKYSKGKFGFSVQKKIWLDCGGKIGEDNYEVFCEFGDRVEWRKGGEWLSYLQYTKELLDTTREGHLPRGAVFGYSLILGKEFGGKVAWESLFSRRDV